MIATQRDTPAIAKTDAQLFSIADNAPFMIWVTDSEGKCTYLNARWFELTGHSRGACLDVEWLDAIHLDDRQRVLDQCLQAHRARTPFRIEYRLETADGRSCWVLHSASPRFGIGGAYRGCIGSLIDVQDHHETETRIRTSESRFRAAVGAVQGVVWTNSASGEMIDDQPGWEALTGQTKPEYLGYGWTAAVHLDDVDSTVEAWHAAVAEKKKFTHENRIRRFDGEWRHHAIHAVPILSADGEIVEWVGVHTDVTEERAAKAALKALNDVLETRVQTEVAARLKAENALRQSQKLEALGALTGGIAHDFNNMLSLITSAFGLLERKLSADDPMVSQFIEVGQDAAVRAAALTKRMLAFARQQPLSPDLVDINSLINNTGHLLAHALGKGIQIDCRLEQQLWPIIVDPSQLENAILNLAVNARDAMNGRGLLSIATFNIALAKHEMPEQLAAGDYVAIVVGDAGVGMPCDVRAKVFEPFFTTKQPGQGTGLGLSQVHGFVKQSGGGIDIVSAPGQGTQVTLYLPRALNNPSNTAA